MTYLPHQDLLNHWKASTQKQRFFQIPDAQLYQMLSYAQQDLDLFDLVIQEYPPFLEQIKYLTLTHFLWNPAFMERHRHHFERCSFFATLDPALSGTVTFTYVQKTPEAFVQHPDTTINLLVKEMRPNLQYTPSMPMQLAWFQKDVKHYVHQYIYESCKQKPNTYNLEESFRQWKIFYALYQETGHPLFAFMIQRPFLGGQDRDVRQFFNDRTSSYAFKSWSKKEFEQFQAQHVDFFFEYALFLLVMVRPKSMEPNDRRKQLWQLMAPHCTSPTLLVKAADQLFDCNYRMHLFHGTILEDKDGVFRQLVDSEVMSSYQYQEFLLDTLTVDPNAVSAEVPLHL